MTTRVHFISGLLRSGSALLACIVRQNPRFHAATSNTVGALFSIMLDAMSRGNETALFIDEAQRKDLLAALFESYYRSQQGKDVIFDTNRVWCARLPAILSLFPVWFSRYRIADVDFTTNPDRPSVTHLFAHL